MASEARLALQALTPEALVAAVPVVTLAEARKIIAQSHRGEPLAATSSIRRVAADAVRAVGDVPTLAITASSASAVDPFVKYLLATADGHAIETVRIPLEDPSRFSVCVSSQVGCALACAFCATGRLGLSRNLAPWEIIEQVRIVRRGITGNARVHGVVFQGMGEPLANLDAVLTAISVMHDPCGLGIDARAITVCTSGLPQGIRRLAEEAPKVRLGLSIGSARPDVRATIMPITRAHGLATVIAAVKHHAITTGLAPMWAVALLDGVNDSPADAEALAALTHDFTAATGKRPRLSIIPYNPIAEAGDPFRRSTPEREAAFRQVLSSSGLPHHKRYSGGGDVGAACGQLAGKVRLPVVAM